MNVPHREFWRVWAFITDVIAGSILGLVAALSLVEPSNYGGLILGGCFGAFTGFLWSLLGWTRTVWTHRVLCVFVGAHVWLITVQSLPAPGGGMNKRDWKSQTVQGEFQAWTTRLKGLGVEIEKEQLEEHLWDLAKGVMSIRREALSPMYGYFRNAGTWQSWRMFVAPHRYPSRLHVDLRLDNEWRSVYVARSAEFDWRSRQLDHDRFRAALFRYGWGKKYPHQWRGFGRWLAREARRDVPEADAIRLRFWSFRTLSPEETRQGVQEEGKWTRTRILSLEPPQ